MCKSRTQSNQQTSTHAKQPTSRELRQEIWARSQIQQEWERQLIDTWGNPLESVSDTKAMLESTSTVKMCSDGAVKYSGTFAWTVRTQATDIMWGTGRAQGAEVYMTSFRAEGYGMLSAVRFMYQY